MTAVFDLKPMKLLLKEIPRIFRRQVIIFPDL